MTAKSISRGALSLLVLMFFLSCQTMGQNRTVSVSGQGTVSAVPDRAEFDITFREIAPTTAEARELVNKKADMALVFLARLGVDSDDIKTTGLNYTTRTRWNDGEEIFLGQQAEQTLHIGVALEDKASNLNEIMDQLTGIDGLGMGRLTFILSDESEARERARQLAFEQARNKAQELARLSGQELGRALIISEGGAAPLSPANVRASGAFLMEAAPTQVQPGQNELSVVIQVVFALK